MNDDLRACVDEGMCEQGDSWFHIKRERVILWCFKRGKTGVFAGVALHGFLFIALLPFGSSRKGSWF